ncbi:MAG: DUF4142 domain-containing protein [Pseudomonadota bacterium]|nr:DUF4142 domain-containing protein [Pseudomonadota bacterium]
MGTLHDTGHMHRMSATDRKFVTQATEGNVKEITLSKIALERTQNSAIRNFAQKIIDDHTEAGQQLASIVEHQNLGGPTEQQAADKAAAEGKGLARLSGDALDRRFASMMVSDHVAAVSLYEKEARAGSDTQLKGFADKTLPTLRQHLEMARGLEPQLSGRAYDSRMTRPMVATTGAGTMAPRVDMQRSDEAHDASAHVSKALETLQKMQRDPEAKAMLARSFGVFLIPDYSRAALGIGAQGGAGVLMVKRDGKWTGPGFYNFGGVSFGAQAGASAGQIAMLLMDEKAVASFAQGNKFSLNSDAGLTLVNYSDRAHGEVGRGDVVVWSDTKGAFANISLSVTDVNFDEEETAAYYGKPVSARNVVTTGVSSAKATRLVAALPK